MIVCSSTLLLGRETQGRFACATKRHGDRNVLCYTINLIAYYVLLLIFICLIAYYYVLF